MSDYRNGFVYLDNASTTRLSGEVLTEMLPYFTNDYGNPSSIHTFGKEAARAVERARQQVAQSINAKPRQIIFTSGSTEGNNWLRLDLNLIPINPELEHHSVRSTKGKYNGVEHTPSIEQLDVYSHIWVNNEVGVIYDIKSIYENQQKKPLPLFHTDATQAFGHLKIDVQKMPFVDFMTFSAHKFHGPKGIGFIYSKDPRALRPILYGGNQERGLRSGTENVPSIIGLGKACKLHQYNEVTDARIKSLRDKLEDYILTTFDNVQVNGKDQNRVSNILSVSFKRCDAQTILEMLSNRHIYVSSGSACNSKVQGPSSVLKYMGVTDEYIYGTMRFSLSEYTTEDEIDYTCHCLKEIIDKIRS